MLISSNKVLYMVVYATVNISLFFFFFCPRIYDFGYAQPHPEVKLMGNHWFPFFGTLLQEGLGV